MSLFITAVFILTYVGMAIGRVPGLAIDRAGIALAAVAVLLIGGALEVADLAAAVDWPTLLLLFALMILGGHFIEAGCFAFIGDWLTHLHVRPVMLLALTVLVAGLLSTVLVNDIVVFAFAPLLCVALTGRGLDPRPFLLALAAASNAGSAMSLIGNPQNILIGELGGLDFLAYLRLAEAPSLAGLVIVFGIIAWLWRNTLRAPAGSTATAMSSNTVHRWLTAKSVLATAVLVVLMLALDERREIAALGVMLVLIFGRSVATRTLIGYVDWPLIVLIACLFIVTATFTALPGTSGVVEWLRANDLLPYRLSVLVPFSLIVSNTIGNVPAVVLLVQVLEDIPPPALSALALFSTLSGNLLLTGSLANIITAERAASQGVRLSFWDFAKAGIPITALSMLVATGWYLWMDYLDW